MVGQHHGSVLDPPEDLLSLFSSPAHAHQAALPQLREKRHQVEDGAYRKTGSIFGLPIGKVLNCFASSL